MEKRKDIDMLRFYGGDIHQKNKEGEYVITNNLVNPKNKEDVLWGDRDAYRTLNALLFDGIENEKERIYKEKRKLNPVFIELIENTLEIYRGIFAVMCRKKGNQLSVSKVKRVDRKASLMAYLKGHTESFVSCTNGEWVIAKRFIQYLCYRKNVFFSKVELSTSYKGYKHIKSGELYVLEDLEEHNSEEEVLKKGCYIRQSYITGAVGSILQSIAEDSIYLRHLPQNYEEGHHIDAARFVMITAAFEWEFRRIFPEGIKKKEKKIKAEETVVQLLTPLIENNSW